MGRNSATIKVIKIASGAILEGDIVRAMGNVERLMTKRAKRIVPKRTWALHDTIAGRVEKRRGKVTAITKAGGGKVGYATHVERGTSRAKAQPYLRPALLQTSARDLKGGK
jgi:hypothetical protein